MADKVLNRIVSVSITSGSLMVIAGPLFTDTAGNIDGTSGDLSRFRNPCGVCTSPDSNYLFITDSGNHNIRMVSLAENGKTTTIAGISAFGYADASTGSSAVSNYPIGITTDMTGSSVFVADFVRCCFVFIFFSFFFN